MCALTGHHSHVCIDLAPVMCALTWLHIHVCIDLAPQSCVHSPVTTVMCASTWHHSHVCIDLAPQSCVHWPGTTVMCALTWSHSHVCIDLAPQSCVHWPRTTAMCALIWKHNAGPWLVIVTIKNICRPTVAGRNILNSAYRCGTTLYSTVTPPEEQMPNAKLRYFRFYKKGFLVSKTLQPWASSGTG